MRCLSCDEGLSDREANRKYINYREIKNPEERYIGLCDSCLRETDLQYPDVEVLNSETIGDGDNDDWIGEGE